MLDTAQVKALLTSDDISSIRKGLDDVANAAENSFSESSAEVQEQLLKLQVMLQSRILSVQQTSNAPVSDLVMTYRGLATLWIRSGDSEKALGQLTKARSLDPNGGNDPETLQLMTRAYLNLSKYEQAIETQEKVIALWQESKDDSDGDNLASRIASAYVQLASVYEAKGEFEQAISLLEKAAENDRTRGMSDIVQAELYGKWGIICEKIGREEQAVICLTKAHELYVKTKGASYYKTEEIAYLLDMASSK